MRFILMGLLLGGFCQAQTEPRKIDMHGGKEQPLYEKKSSFQNVSFGKAAFVDANATKESLPTSKK